jgi:transposase
MAIELPDARHLPDEVLKALRLRALHGCEQGYPEESVADLVGVVRETVSRWWSAYVDGGLDAIPQDRTGRPRGSGRTLDDEQSLHIQSLMNGHTPDEQGIGSPIWTRRAVRDLIHKEYGIRMPIRTVGEYLKRWGYTPKKPRRKALYQDPEEVEEWLEKIYPAIEEFAKKEDAEILWCDEKGVGANDYPGRGYALVGQTPEIKVSSSPCRMNLISTISNEGEVRFMTYKETMTALLFLAFLPRLIHGASRKIFLIVDRLPAHEAEVVETWLRGREDKIEMFYLPRRAPELNPVECLNNDVKLGVNATKLPENERELKSNMQRFMHRLAKLPAHIMSYFENPFIQYAAGIM